MKNSQGQANHLQILASGGCRDVPWLRAYIVDDALLQPGNEEMRALVDNRILHSRVSIEDDSASASLDIVNRGLKERRSQGKRDRSLVEST